MWNIFKRPINPESLESWVKMLDDLAKVALVTIPVLLYGSNSVLFKVINALLLVAISYAILFISNQLRQHKSQLIQEK
ncbi:MAG: hypothetical protein Q4A60_01940 [Pasteurellaceae bacterium]|nr:hypothetical protein [Pasteurellaceae bacterium]